MRDGDCGAISDCDRGWVGVPIERALCTYGFSASLIEDGSSTMSSSAGGSDDDQSQRQLEVDSVVRYQYCELHYGQRLLTILQSTDQDSAYGDEMCSAKAITTRENCRLTIFGRSTYTTSLSSSIKDFREENGRTYHSFREG